MNNHLDDEIDEREITITTIKITTRRRKRITNNTVDESSENNENLHFITMLTIL